MGPCRDKHIETIGPSRCNSQVARNPWVPRTPMMGGERKGFVKGLHVLGGQLV